MGATQGEAVNKPEIRGKFWRLAWLREKASLVVRAAAPPPLLSGEPCKPPKPTSDGPDLSLSSFYPLDYNQLLRTSPQMPPPEFPKGRKLSKLRLKLAVSAHREEARHDWKARERAVFSLPTLIHLESEASGRGRTQTLCTRHSPGTINHPHSCH